MPLIVAQLQGYVQRHTRQYGTEFAVTEFADGMELLDDYRPVYDILLLGPRSGARRSCRRPDRHPAARTTS